MTTISIFQSYELDLLHHILTPWQRQDEATVGTKENLQGYDTCGAKHPELKERPYDGHQDEDHDCRYRDIKIHAEISARERIGIDTTGRDHGSAQYKRQLDVDSLHHDEDTSTTTEKCHRHSVDTAKPGQRIKSGDQEKPDLPPEIYDMIACHLDMMDIYTLLMLNRSIRTKYLPRMQWGAYLTKEV